MVVETQGDRRLDVPIWELGGKGVFAKEVQAAVLDGRADLAVHSAKDLPSVTVPGPRARRGARARRPARRAGRARRSPTCPRAPRWPPARCAAGSQLRRHRPDLRFVEPARQHADPPGQGRASTTRSWWRPTALDRLGLADQIAERLDVDVDAAAGRRRPRWRSSAAPTTTTSRALLAAHRARADPSVRRRRARLPRRARRRLLPARRRPRRASTATALHLTAFLASPDGTAPCARTHRTVDAGSRPPTRAPSLGRGAAPGHRSRLDSSPTLDRPRRYRARRGADACDRDRLRAPGVRADAGGGRAARRRPGERASARPRHERGGARSSSTAAGWREFWLGHVGVRPAQPPRPRRASSRPPPPSPSCHDLVAATARQVEADLDAIDAGPIAPRRRARSSSQVDRVGRVAGAARDRGAVPAPRPLRDRRRRPAGRDRVPRGRRAR